MKVVETIIMQRRDPKDDGKTAKLVVFVADSITASGTTEDIVYLAGNANQKASSDTRTTDKLWFMKDLTNPAGTIITDDETAGMKFYTYSVSDGVYKLDSNADHLNPTAAYDDEDGFVEDMTITSVYKSKSVSFSDSKFSDVSFNGVTIIDTRSSSVRKASLYDTEITTIADLKDAVETCNGVVADVYFDAGVKFIAVVSVGEGYTITNSATETNGMTIATVPTKAGEDATVTVTLTGTAAAAGTMKIMDGTDVLATVKVVAGATSATASFTMPQANVELTLAFVAD